MRIAGSPPLIALLGLLVAALPAAARAATRAVPADYPTVQAALDAAGSGDLVLVAPGTWRENLKIRRAVTLASWFHISGDAAAIAATVLDGSARPLVPVIEIPQTSEPGSVVTGFTIQHDGSADGVVPFVRVDLFHNVIRNTQDGVDYENGSGGIARYNVFEDNGDDGIDLQGRVQVTAEHNVVRNNGEDGFEIRLEPYSGPTLEIAIRHNEISGNGQDGIQIIGYGADTDRRLDIRGNRIRDNGAAGIGCLGNPQKTDEVFDAASLGEPIFAVGNTFASNSHGISCGDNVVAVNNLFAGHSVLALKNLDGNSVAAWNLFHANATDQVGSNLDPAHNLSADPLLAADASLLPGSPAIDAGTDFFAWQGAAVVDLAPGDYAGAAPDLGAVEFAGGGGAADGLPPEPPADLSSPAQGVTSVDLAWSEARDAGSGVASYRVYRDGVLEGSTAGLFLVAGGLPPDQSHRFEVTALDGAGNESAPSEALVVSTLDPAAILSLEVAVRAGEDDAEEYVSSGAAFLTSSDLELGQEGSSAQRVGLRFHGVAVPRGARIAAAHLQFAVDESSGSGAALEIRGQAVDAAPAFSSANRDIGSRPITASSVAWTPAAWPGVGEAGAAQRTPDLRQVVQEIVDRPGWSSGNALVLIATGSGSRVAESFEGSPATAPVLEIDFTHEGVAPDTTPPGAPVGLSSPGQTATSVDLAWDAASDDRGVVGYDLFQDGVPRGSTPATQATVGALAAGTSYDFHVLARDAAGNASEPSATLAVATRADSDPTPLEVRVAIAGGADDAEERLNLAGAMELGSTDLELTRDGTREQVVGLRFRAVPVPAGASLLSAHVQFTVDEASSGAADLEIRAEAADSAAPFSGAPGNLSARPTTAGFAPWSPPAWGSPGAAGADQRTPDLAALLQEVVSRPGWASGQALVLLVKGSGARVAEAFEGSPAQAPALVLRYGIGPPAPDGAPPAPPANLRSPAQTASSIDLAWDAASDDVGVVGYRVYRDGALAASPAGTAHRETGLAAAASHLFEVTALDAAGHESAPSVGLRVSTQAPGVPLRLLRRVAASRDDAEEVIGSGAVTLTSGDLELTEDGSGAARVVGLRFADLAVPQGAVIVSARVQFSVDETGSGASALSLRAQDADHAAPFTSARGDLSARPWSAAAVAWSPPAWTALGAAGAAQRTPDLAALVQGVVDRPGFRAGNALALLVTGSGARVAESSDGSPDQAPLLEVEYLAP